MPGTSDLGAPITALLAPPATGTLALPAATTLRPGAASKAHARQQPDVLRVGVGVRFGAQ